MKRVTGCAKDRVGLTTLLFRRDGMMKMQLERRAFIALLGASCAAPALPRPSFAQQKGKPTIGVLFSGKSAQEIMDAFNQGMTQSGLVPGSDVMVNFVWGDDQYDRLSGLAKDLASKRPSVIAALGLASALAAKPSAARIPLVFVVEADPVKFGLVTDLSQPGGNATGVSFSASALIAMQIDLIGKLVKNAPSTGLLLNPNNSRLMLDLEAAASTRAQKLIVVKAGQEGDIEGAFKSLAGQGVKDLVVPGDPFFFDQRAKLVALAAQYKVPTIYPAREFAAAGGLMSYGGSLADMYRQSGVYVGRILKGEKPGDLPVQQATKVELIINLKTARALGLTVPLPLIGRADEVIE
jgi:putative ABC transport system substrate-binding protein